MEDFGFVAGHDRRELVLVRRDPIPPLKQQLADEILDAVSSLNVTIAAAVLDIGASRLGDLRHGRVGRFSVERLIRILAVIDRRVSLTVVNEGAAEIRWFRVLRQRRVGGDGDGDGDA